MTLASHACYLLLQYLRPSQSTMFMGKFEDSSSLGRAVLKTPFTLLVRGTITVSAGEDFGL
jgi:hypothetical protein